jgi:hypothetical protein
MNQAAICRHQGIRNRLINRVIHRNAGCEGTRHAERRLLQCAPRITHMPNLSGCGRCPYGVRHVVAHQFLIYQTVS